MSIISVVIVLCVVGVLLWLVRTYVPLAAPFPSIITAVVVIAVVLWLLSAVGVLGSISGARLPRVR
jgi:low temperature requirement protein LtrA